MAARREKNFADAEYIIRKCCAAKGVRGKSSIMNKVSIEKSRLRELSRLAALKRPGIPTAADHVNISSLSGGKDVKNEPILAVNYVSMMLYFWPGRFWLAVRSLMNTKNMKE